MSKKSFAEIYGQWERISDDKSKIEKIRKDPEPTKLTKPTINEVRRMKVQDELDLHCMTVKEALENASVFIEDSSEKKLKKIRLITGKGLHSGTGSSVVRENVLSMVRANSHVREVYTPSAAEGGSGALMIILKF